MGFIRWWNNYWDRPPCQTCEELKSLLATEKHEKKLMLEYLLRESKPEPPPSPIQLNTPTVNPKTWKVRREMLEEEDRRQAEILRKKNEELEKELIGTND